MSHCERCEMLTQMNAEQQQELMLLRSAEGGMLHALLRDAEIDDPTVEQVAIVREVYTRERGPHSSWNSLVRDIRAACGIADKPASAPRKNKLLVIKESDLF